VVGDLNRRHRTGIPCGTHVSDGQVVEEVAADRSVRGYLTKGIAAKLTLNGTVDAADQGWRQFE
jgi:hypothetical protein